MSIHMHTLSMWEQNLICILQINPDTANKDNEVLLQSKKSKVRPWTASRANFAPKLRNGLLTGNMAQMKKVVGYVGFQHIVVC